MYFTIYKDRNSEFRWRFKSSNGRIIADSAEGYTSEANAINGIDLLRSHAATANIYKENY